MSANPDNAGHLGFLDSLARLVRPQSVPAPKPAATAATSFAKLGSEFDAAVQALQQKIEEGRRAESEQQETALSAGATAEDRAAERARRMEACHSAIRADIVAMHERMGTGIDSTQLDELLVFCADLEKAAVPGRGSLDLLPRLRWALVDKLRSEAGRLAVDRLAALMRAAELEWPDPTQYHPSATPEDIERSRRRRLAEMREGFVGQSLTTATERMLGIVSTWGSDYPAQGSPLWQESVLEGIAAGIRALLLRDFVTRLRENIDALMKGVEGSVGKELANLQEALGGGVASTEQAQKALAGSLRVLDEVVPHVAWEQLCESSPLARGEFPS